MVAGMNAIDVARAAAEAASTILLARRGHAGTVSTKQNRTDLVSETDVIAERAIVKIIRGHFPSHVIVAEEGSALGNDGDHRWYIDPLDGTSNYLHLHPFYCVSIAYEHRGELATAVIAAPTLDEFYLAERGSGAYLNGERLHVSSTGELGDAMLATGFAYGIPERIANVDYWRAFVDKCSAIRRDGSAALDLAFVAAGRFDGYWEAPLHAWDIAAGALMVREAGGQVSDYHGGEVDIMNPAVVASNGLLHNRMLSVIAAIPTIAAT